MHNMKSFAAELIKLNLDFLKKRGIENISLFINIIDKTELGMIHTLQHAFENREILELIAYLTNIMIKNHDNIWDNDFYIFIEWLMKACAPYLASKALKKGSSNEAIH